MVLGPVCEVLQLGSNSRGFNAQGTRIWRLGLVIFVVLVPGHEDRGPAARNSCDFRSSLRRFGGLGA